MDQVKERVNIIIISSLCIIIRVKNYLESSQQRVTAIDIDTYYRNRTELVSVNTD